MSFFRKKVSPEQQKVVDNLRNVIGDKDFKIFERLVKDELDKPPKVAIIGKTGVGKSTTINALFNLDEKVSHTTHGTTKASRKVVELPKGGKLAVIDMPGMGEDIKLHPFLVKLLKKRSVTLSGGGLCSKVRFGELAPTHSAQSVPVKTDIFRRGIDVGANKFARGV